MSEADLSPNRPYWILRVVETCLLVTSVAGIGLFAYSLIDIVRIESNPAAAGSVPPFAWPGVFVFLGSMVGLQVVRVFLERYRREDGAPRGGEARAAKATAEALADLPPADVSAANALDDASDR